MEYGIVYLLTNPVMPDFVKIGMTTLEDIDKKINIDDTPTNINEGKPELPYRRILIRKKQS